MAIYHVAYATNTKYAQYLAVSLYSLLSHQRLDGDAQWHIHLLSEDNKVLAHPALQEIQERFPDAFLESHTIKAENYEGYQHKWYNLHSMLRGFLPDLIPEIERLLYLDVDTLIVGDLTPLLNMDMRGCALGMVEEIFHRNPRGEKKAHKIGVPYFNSGVILMNLQQLREENFPQRFWEHMTSHLTDYDYPDQDTINVMYKNQILPLSQVYNVMNYTLHNWEEYGTPELEAEYLACLYHPVVIHYAISAPWHQDLQRHPYNQLWLDANQQLKHRAKLTYKAKGWLRFKIWMKRHLCPSSKAFATTIEMLREQWKDRPQTDTAE